MSPRNPTRHHSLSWEEAVTRWVEVSLIRQLAHDPVVHPGGIGGITADEHVARIVAVEVKRHRRLVRGELKDITVGPHHGADLDPFLSLFHQLDHGGSLADEPARRSGTVLHPAADEEGARTIQ